VTDNIRNAVIESVDVSIEHGALTCMVNLNFGDFRQGFGGFPLHPVGIAGDRGGWFLYNLLDVVGVLRLADLPGKAVRARANPSGGIAALGHIFHDEWFSGREP